jgi:hypothetical protein
MPSAAEPPSAIQGRGYDRCQLGFSTRRRPKNDLLGFAAPFNHHRQELPDRGSSKQHATGGGVQSERRLLSSNCCLPSIFQSCLCRFIRRHGCPPSDDYERDFCVTIEACRGATGISSKAKNSRQLTYLTNASAVARDRGARPRAGAPGFNDRPRLLVVNPLETPWEHPKSTAAERRFSGSRICLVILLYGGRDDSNRQFAPSAGICRGGIRRSNRRHRPLRCCGP